MIAEPMKRSVLSFLALILLLGTTACAVTEKQVRPAQYTKRVEAGLSPEDHNRIDKNCPFGMPKTDPAWKHGPTRIVARDGYVLQHSSLDKIPLWVCESILRDQLLGDLERDDSKFQADPLLQGYPRAELSDYKRSGYDRGHQAPAGNQTVDQRLKDETFYLSNMAPQLGALNQQIWKELEILTRDWVKDERVQAEKIITGGMFFDPKEENTDTATGLIEHDSIGKNKVSVPTHFYKIVVFQGKDGLWNAVAFVLENKGYPRPYDFSAFIKSVDWIEERTGINFMPDLDNPQEERLERRPGRLVSN